MQPSLALPLWRAAECVCQHGGQCDCGRSKVEAEYRHYGGALAAGNDVFCAAMTVEQAKLYCQTLPDAVGFTFSSTEAAPGIASSQKSLRPFPTHTAIHLVSKVLASRRSLCSLASHRAIQLTQIVRCEQKGRCSATSNRLAYRTPIRCGSGAFSALQKSLCLAKHRATHLIKRLV